MLNRRDNRIENPVQRPEACPFCESKAVGTLAKVITVSTYWRCQSCGEMWNPQRLQRHSLPPRRGSSW